MLASIHSLVFQIISQSKLLINNRNQQKNKLIICQNLLINIILFLKQKQKNMDQQNYFNDSLGFQPSENNDVPVIYEQKQTSKHNQDIVQYMMYEQASSLGINGYETYYSQQPQDFLEQLPIQQQIRDAQRSQQKQIEKQSSFQIQTKKNQEADQSFIVRGKTKRIRKEMKNKNKKQKIRPYNHQQESSKNQENGKRKYGIRGNNTNNEPKIFGAVVKNALYDLNLELNQTYKHQGRYYLHSAYSQAEGNGCAQQFMAKLEERIKQKMFKRQKKGQDNSFFTNYLNSIKILKKQLQETNTDALRNSFKLIYNHQINDSDDLDSYKKAFKDGYKKVEKLRQSYKLKHFFN